MRKGIARLEGKVAVVTGAASGIGRELALGLWRKGCSLALVDLDEKGLEQLATELTQHQSQQRVSQHVVDVGNRVAMQAVAAEVVSKHQHIHLLINNAGVGYEAAFPQTSLEDCESVLQVNLWGTIHGCHFFLPYLAKQQQAHIVNLSSLFGIIAMPGQTAYCTSKFAVRGFSEALAEELRTTSIGLTLVHPGSVATNIMKTSKGDDPELLGRIAQWYELNALPPQLAAAQIIRAIETGKPRLLITREVVFADWVKRLLPVLGNKAIVDLVIRVLGLEDMRAKRKQLWLDTMVKPSSGQNPQD